MLSPYLINRNNSARARAFAQIFKSTQSLGRSISRKNRSDWTVLATLLLVSCWQLFCSSQLYGLPPDMNAAAAAKTKAGLEALAHIPTDFPGSKTAGNFITFDAPAAVKGTFPSKINQTGMVTGYYNDANSVSHGFLRDQSGNFTTFDIPSATFGIAPTGINPEGVITGVYYDINFLGHGFVWAKNGPVATFDAPGAAFIGTVPSDINPAGEITGSYYDVNFVGHGFVRAKNGTLTTFDAPGAGTTGNFPGTYAVCITPNGTTVGMYTDVNGDTHGFLRTTGGGFTTFDPPGSIAVFAAFSFGQNLYINPDGLITGTYFEPISGNPFGGNYRVFVRAVDDTFTTFDAATYPPCFWSFPCGITPAGAITGSLNDGYQVNHGFLRASDGTVTTFDVPEAGKSINQGTAPLGITPAGEIMGLYIDANRVTHGFLFQVKPLQGGAGN
jgi:hypothetical protein